MKLFEFLNILNLPFDLILKHFKSINNYVVKSNDENIEMLLENDTDKVKFQHAIDQLLKDNGKSREVNIKNKNVTISI